jgi:Predicted aspartyl protease
MRFPVWTLIFVAAIWWNGALPAQAQNVDYQKGEQLFKARQYKSALVTFNQAMKKSPNDPYIFWYMGMSYHYLRDFNNAKACYAGAVKYGHMRQPAVESLRALMKIDLNLAKELNAEQERLGGGYAPLTAMGAPTAGGAAASASSAPQRASSVQSYASSSTRTYSGSSSSSSLSSGSDLPREGRVPFTIDNQNMFVEAQVNGRSTKCLFDTGAQNCVIGADQLQKMGLQPPTGAVVGIAGDGAGGGGGQERRQMNVTLTVGNITRRNFPLMVQATLATPPLIGQSFFKEFHYEIDNASSSISFKRSDTSSGSIYRAANSIPFTEQEGHLIVEGEVNGRRTQMIFDTGAHLTAFTPDQLKALGISIPVDAVEGTMAGIKGSASNKIFPVSKIKLGSVEKRDVQIQVLQGLPCPLLGQSFFGDKKYSIDNVNHVITFR